MKAFVARSYGSPDVLDLRDVDQPEPADDEVLVRVRATSVNPYDWHLMRGEPLVARLLVSQLGLRSPKLRVLGCDMAGQVEAAGRNVTSLRPGDDVFALLDQGGFAEYVCVAQDLLARMPANVSYEQAAAVPMAAVTALLSLRDTGRLRPGQQVLVNGASGGVGTFAVQIARALGASVTGVCSGRNAGLVRSLGAQEVVDYTAEDFTRNGRVYDLILDIAGSRAVLACSRALSPRGTLVVVGGPAGRWLQPVVHALSTRATAPLTSRRVATPDVVGSRQKKQSLSTLAGFIQDGKITPVIDRSFSFGELPEAVRYQELGHAPGKVVVTVS